LTKQFLENLTFHSKKTFEILVFNPIFFTFTP
jgi:hypothetical protein